MEKVGTFLLILSALIFILGMGFSLSGFGLFYPAIGDPDFFNKAHKTMKLLSIIRMIWFIGSLSSFFIGSLCLMNSK